MFNDKKVVENDENFQAQAKLRNPRQSNSFPFPRGDGIFIYNKYMKFHTLNTAQIRMSEKQFLDGTYHFGCCPIFVAWSEIYVRQQWRTP